MANLTITIDDRLLKLARIKALHQGTSVNALLREYLEAYAGAVDARTRSLDDLLELSAGATSSRGSASWTRGELHERGADVLCSEDFQPGRDFQGLRVQDPFAAS